MTVLVASASKHGATEEIAKAIGEVLEAQGVQVEVRRMQDVGAAMPYEAFVIGSAVYMGSWLRVARDFVDEHRDVIVRRPTWLFSSGPIGSRSAEFDITAIAAATRARDHHLFGGRLDNGHLGLVERAVARALHAPRGDYREWDAVAAWATAIARSLGTEAPV